MQVGVAKEGLQNDEAFQSASYGFTLSSVFALSLAIAILLCILLYLRH